ncbi:VOC family protein [Paralcaligenes ureilyticus]|uniref:Glyoxalase-like protein n=1 Tax=Paralcaligenes ureilyticus TaxID=627131 RepID=A0A4V2UYV1_9BURK|nr:VOC family protein [Paralcaligenes ureilyticus]TCT08848.1 glyoxalase-like protein [Paralcaligenes ureilyticus]
MIVTSGEAHGADGSYPVSEHVDHVVIHVGQSLDEAQAQYARLGFHLTPRGHHSLGSSNHLAIFGSDYFELMGVEPRNVAKFANGWGHPLGLSGLVFKASDAAALWQRLVARQVPLEGNGPNDFFRPVDLPDHGTHDARFRTVRIAADSIPNGRVFFCEHLTPNLVWRTEWQRHANGVNGILEYVYVTQDPAASAAILDRAFGPGAVVPVEHGLRLQAGGVSVLYLLPQGVAARFGDDAGALPEQGERAVALTLRTGSLQRARDALRIGRIEHVREVGGRIIVPAAQAAGVILAFEER